MRVTKFLNTTETFFCKFELQPLDTPTPRNPTLFSIWIQGKDIKLGVNIHDQFMTLRINNNATMTKEVPHASFSFNDALKLGFELVFERANSHWIPLNPELIDYDKFLKDPFKLSNYYDIK